MMENQELMFVDKQIADRIKNLENVDQIEVINKILEERKQDMRLDMENLESDMLQFKVFAMKYRKELEEVYKDQQDKAYKLWEKYNEELPRIQAAIQPVIDEVNKLTVVVDTLNNKLEKITSWEVDKLSKLIDSLRTLSTRDASRIREIVRILTDEVKVEGVKK
jgi:hypothetical protein